MDFVKELNQFEVDPKLESWLTAKFEQSEQALKNANHHIEHANQEIEQYKLKIQKLLLELAYYRRIRFDKKSEALTPGPVNPV